MLPDVVDFAADLLMTRGGLVEKDPEGMLAVLPAEVAHLFGLPESCVLSPLVNADNVVAKRMPCNFGTPALERLIDVGRATIPVATARVNLESPRLSHARSLAARFTPRNGLSEVISIGVREDEYLVATFVWVAESDDRYEGLLRLVMCCDDGAEPDEAFQANVDPIASSVLMPAASATERHGIEVVAAYVGRRVAARLERTILPVTEVIRRRHVRDHKRITEYFASMIHETMAPCRRRRDACKGRAFGPRT